MKAKKIILSILDENAVSAKKLISEDLSVKLGQRLAEEYVRVAKLTFNEAIAGKDEEQDGEEDEEQDGEEDEEQDGEEDEEGGEEAPMTNMQAPGQTSTGFDVRLSYGD